MIKKIKLYTYENNVIIKNKNYLITCKKAAQHLILKKYNYYKWKCHNERSYTMDYLI